MGFLDYLNFMATWRMARQRHEIVGIVTEVGSTVKNVKIGDKVGAGYFVGSCRSCKNCLADLENYCPEAILSFNSTYYDGTNNYEEQFFGEISGGVRAPSEGIRMGIKRRFWYPLPPSLSPAGKPARKTLDLKCFTVVCHSDLHSIKNEWGFVSIPWFLGQHAVIRLWESLPRWVAWLKRFKLETVGVGCLVGSCHSCNNCDNHLENYCSKMIQTYSSTYHDGTLTHGGYSDSMVADGTSLFAGLKISLLMLVRLSYVLRLQFTVYNLIKLFGFGKPGMPLGVVGLGGLGHVAVKFAKAFGAKVTVISTSPNKKEEAITILVGILS